MGIKRWVFLVVMLVSVIMAYGAITGNVVLDVPKDVNITLSKIEYGSNEDLEGEFSFNIRGLIRENTKVVFKLEDQVKEVFLKDLLDEQEIGYEVVASTLKGVNPVSSKKLFFEAQGKQNVYIKLPRDSKGIKINMRIKGEELNGSYPKRASMDVGADELLEWLYLGDFTGFSGGLESTANFSIDPSSSAIMDNLGKYLCQGYELEKYVKDIEVNAKYSLFDSTSTGGDINASILSPSGTGNSIRGYGGGDVCDLPEPGSTTLESNKCRLRLPAPIKGSYMLCVYNAKRGVTSKNFYKLGTNNVNSNKAYVCNTPDPNKGYGDCTRVQDTFYIGFRYGDYSEILNTEVGINDGKTDRNFSRAIVDFLSICEELECMVPIEIRSNTRGTITLSNLQIIYTKSGLTKEETSFYDVQGEEAYINKIDNVDLSTGNVTLNIPISVSGFKTGYTAKNKNVEFEISFNPGPSLEKMINVKGIVAARTVDIVEEAKKDLERFNTDYRELVEFMGLSQLIGEVSEEITSKEQEIDNIISSNLSENEKNTKKDKLIEEISSLREKLPKKIELKQDITDIVAVSPDDVEKAVSEDNKDVIYNLQSEVKIEVGAKLYEVTDYSNKVAKKTLINKKVNGRFGAGYVVEIIPKEIVREVNEIVFSDEPEVIEDDPIVRWDYDTLPFEASYLVEGDALSNLGETKTVVIPEKLEERVPEEAQSVCGNNKCEFLRIGDRIVPLEDEFSCPQDCEKKTPWMWIVLILLAAGIGLGYIYYRKKLPLFRSKVDEENLRRYVQKSIEQKHTKDKINKTLLEKGWNQRQIDYVYDKLLNKKEEKKKLFGSKPK